MKDTIFLVGKTDPNLESVKAIQKQGYKAGIFLDNSIHLKHANAFDTIIPLNFRDLASEISAIKAVKNTIAGLLCTYENYVTAKATLATQLDLPGTSPDAARLATDKYLMRQAFMQADPKITPRFRLVTSEEELLAFATSTTYPLIIKPTNLVKSLLVLRCDSEKELLENFTYAQNTIGELYEKYAIYNRTPQLIVEEFIRGKSCSIAAFVDSAGIPHFADGITALETASEHGANDNYLYSRTLPADIDTITMQRLFDVAEIGVKALRMRSTPAHIELIYDRDEVKIVEIGARIGGYRPRMYNYSYGVDLISQEVALALGKTPDLRGAFRAYSAVFELFPDKIGEFKELTGLKKEINYTYLSIKPKPSQHIGPAKNGYKAAAVIIVVHEDEKTFKELCRTVDTIKVEVKS